MRDEQLGRALRDAANGYERLADQASRTSARARIIGLLDRAVLASQPLTTRTINVDEIAADAALRGAIVMHADLASRSGLSSEELSITAGRGVVMVAFHADLPEFPVGVCLALPSRELVSTRVQLFDDEASNWSRGEVITPFTLASNPGGLGAGRALVRAMVDLARAGGRRPRVVAFSPLTGLRARIIQLVDDPATWTGATSELSAGERDQLAEQLTRLLALSTLPERLEEPAASFLDGEARTFAASDRYRVGGFHVHMGASLVGVVTGADRDDSDAMWSRAHFDYP